MAENTTESEFGLRCPKCDCRDVDTYLSISHRVSVRGVSAQLQGFKVNLTTVDLDSAESATCCKCGHEATVADFRVKSVRQMLLDVANKVLKANSEMENGRDTAPYGSKQMRPEEWDAIAGAAEAATEAFTQRGLYG